MLGDLDQRRFRCLRGDWFGLLLCRDWCGEQKKRTNGQCENTSDGHRLSPLSPFRIPGPPETVNRSQNLWHYGRLRIRMAPCLATSSPGAAITLDLGTLTRSPSYRIKGGQLERDGRSYYA